MRFWLLVCSVLVLGCRSRDLPPNIVLIVLDTTRPDRLSAYGHEAPTTPFLKSFAKSGVRYERSWSVSSWTLPSHATMFTGVHPDVHQATQETQEMLGKVDTVAERLQRSGYQTAGFTNNPWVSEKVGLSRGFQTFSHMWVLRKERRAQTEPLTRNATLVEVERWMEEDLSSRKPFFVFINLIQPHLPYTPSQNAAKHFFDSTADYNAASKRFEGAGKLTVRHYQGIKPLSGKDWGALKALYEGELRQVDHVTKQLVNLLKSAREQETVVIITSDHGEHHNEHGHFAHVFSLYEELVRVPMLISGPGFEAGAVVEEPVSLLDLAPTILAIAGSSTDDLTGVDLRGAIPAERTLPLSYNWPSQALQGFPDEMKTGEALAPYRRGLRGAVHYPYKLIRGSDGEELYFNLESDPAEMVPLAPMVVPESIRAALDATTGTPAGSTEAATTADPGLDETTAEELRLLGYIE